MSSFAIIPWTDGFLNDRLFERHKSRYIDGLIAPYVEFKDCFEKRGHIVHTIDKYHDYSEIDYFLFFTLDWDIYKEALKYGKDAGLVYCTAEPPSVHRRNSKPGYRVLKHIFPYILTWNDSWIDNKSIFKRNMPYWFEDQREGNLLFEEKKLLTSISGNKKSSYKGELYSERAKAIDFFEKNHPSEFDFYGTGWDGGIHPCYKGVADDKSQIYHKYRFCICYENIEGLNGYVTEKLLDCLVSGIVPVYAGAPDISKYVPESCYIKLREFGCYSDLYDHLASMSESEYSRYLFNADHFLRSGKREYFSGTKYAEFILEAISQDKKGFQSSKMAYKIMKRF